MVQYENYKNNLRPPVTFPMTSVAGKEELISNLNLVIFLTDFQYKTKLHFVRIYFDTPTFDIIRKESKIKLSDMVAVVGGTMGLFTGFSIISGVELLYFVSRLLCHLYKIMLK